MCWILYLVFRKVKRLVDHVVREFLPQDGDELLQLLGVARHEGDALAGGHAGEGPTTA